MPIPNVLFVFLCVVISSFRSLRTGSQVFTIFMVFLCVILHTMSSGGDVCCSVVFGTLVGVFVFSVM